MRPPSPALHAARAVAHALRAPLRPVDGVLPEDVQGAVLIADAVPSDDLLGEIAGMIGRLAAVIMWCEGWTEAEAVAALGRHGLEHGTVEVTPDGALCALVAGEDDAARIAPVLARRADRRFRALAIMPAYNEADVIFHSIGALVAEGIDVYLIDHESTDGTIDAASPWLGRGLVHIERFPEDCGYAERNRHHMVWRDILGRVQAVTGEVDADWYLFVNADEFREAPWPATRLVDGLQEVDELGYSAVNFELFDFRPTDDRFVCGEDVRLVLRQYEPPGRHDVLQIKAWKRQTHPVDLVSHGGHDVLFEGKRVFPVPFILRHYPIRSSEHGRRKVLGERMPRFAPEERADGWHVQYDRYANGDDYLHDPATLSTWDDGLVRTELLARAVRQLLLGICLAGSDPAARDIQVDLLTGWLARRGTAGAEGADLALAQQRLALAAGGAPLASDPALDPVARDLALALQVSAILRGDLKLSASLSDAHSALSTAAA